MIALNLDHLPKFEIAPEELHNAMTYTEAVLYVFCLGDGWRLPTLEETEVSIPLWDCWRTDDHEYSNSHRQLACIPVRDLS
jgi:hypothetical protein